MWCGASAKIIDQAPEDFEKVSRVNYVGVVNTVKAALPGMLERDNGRILIMGSMSGVLGAPLLQTLRPLDAL